MAPAHQAIRNLAKASRDERGSMEAHLCTTLILERKQ
jgi:hypothetical protein